MFLDNSPNEEDIIANIFEALSLANQNGSAIVICHARTHTVAAWQRVIDDVKKSGIELVSVADLLELPSD